MDIDSPPAASDPFDYPHTHLDLPTFSASFPLPFRVLFLIALAIFLWATNLHILHSLGLDTSWILGFRDDGADDPSVESIELSPEGTPASTERSSRPESGKLYGPVYKLGCIYLAWVGSGWLLWRFITQDDTEKMETWRGLVGFVAVVAIAGAIIPWRGIGERERSALRRVLKRIFLGSLASPVFFSDVILADMITSFAKVLGDLWVSSCQIWTGGITHGRVAQTGWSNHITLFMVCLPYLLRFKQCMIEYYQSDWTTTRHLANAFKYFSAFPVILFSAAQKAKVYDLALKSGQTMEEFNLTHSRWFGEHTVFRLWLLAVVVNSMFSFWWDVEMDWGLSLCEVDTWLGPPIDPNSRHRYGIWTRIKRLFGTRPRDIISHQRSPAPTPGPRNHDGSLITSSPITIVRPNTPWTTFGLRQILLLPDPLVYHLFTIIDLILRFTWSLKLSSHLHSISEIESGVFMMEALELVRRWMWCFIRIEWEAVKKSEAQRLQRSRGDVIWENGVNKDNEVFS